MDSGSFIYFLASWLRCCGVLRGLRCRFGIDRAVTAIVIGEVYPWFIRL